MLDDRSLVPFNARDLQQRRRERALHLKIDELILAKTGARNEVIGAEQKAEEEIEELGADHADL